VSDPREGRPTRQIARKIAMAVARLAPPAQLDLELSTSRATGDGGSYLASGLPALTSVQQHFSTFFFARVQ